MPNFTKTGLDYAWGRPRYGSLRAAGVDFVMRYVSHDSAKDLLPAERDQLDKVGVPYGIVFETTANRALSGKAGGAADARTADARRKQLGYANMPVYFAVDFDARGSKLAQVADYIGGAVSVLGYDEVGAYGGYFVIQYLYEHNVCRWHWQTYAWSQGIVFGLKALVARPFGKTALPGAHIYQYRNGVTVAGVSSDWNKATAEGMGSLRGKTFIPPKPPPPVTYASRSLKQGDTGADVAETQRYLAKILGRKVDADGVYGPQTEQAKHDAMWKLGWPSAAIRWRDRSRSINPSGLKVLRDPQKRSKAYKAREKQRAGKK